MLKALPGVLFIIIGVVVFSLPHWLPLVSDVRVEPEAFTRSGQVGGGLIGIGLVFATLGFLKSKK